MPRVNRDLQRRLAARRERERRRPPSERGYRFATPDAAELPADLEEEQLDGDAELVPAAPAAARPARREATTVPRERTTPRLASKPFSAYRAEYAYVAGDLRRIVVVIGSLLVVLIVLSFVLPR
jgi:hypothetical protein